MMMVDGRRQTKKALKQDVDFRRLKKVLAAHNMGDLLRRVIDDNGKVVGRLALAAGNSKITNLCPEGFCIQKMVTNAASGFIEPKVREAAEGRRDIKSQGVPR